VFLETHLTNVLLPKNIHIKIYRSFNAVVQHWLTQVCRRGMLSRHVTTMNSI